MRSRLVILVAVVIAAMAVIFPDSGMLASPDPSISPASLTSHPASYLGVYEKGPHIYEPVAGFTTTAGREPNLVGYYSGWGNRSRLPSRGSEPRLGLADRYRRLCSYLRSFADSVCDFGIR